MRALASVTFVYDKREDRILAIINAGRPDAWSCWLTRRLTHALLGHAAEFLTHTSTLAQRAPANLRGEFAAFERDAAMASTANSMSNTPSDILRVSAAGAELADRVTISQQNERFRLELHGSPNDGAAGTLTRAELQRVLQMLHGQAALAEWLSAANKSQSAVSDTAADLTPVRH